jgi:DNA-binding transcriptional ArsR family regulator
MSSLDSRPLRELFGLLKNRRRRYALYCLNEAEDEVLTLKELVDQLVRWEAKWGDGETAPTDERQTIRVELHHNHLPRLAEAGLVDYDTRSQTVRNATEPSVATWAEDAHEEVPHLRALFCSSATG